MWHRVLPLTVAACAALFSRPALAVSRLRAESALVGDAAADAAGCGKPGKAPCKATTTQKPCFRGNLKIKDKAHGPLYKLNPGNAEYKQCGKVLNEAWREERESKCGHDAIVAADQFRDHVESCMKHPRWADNYVHSYRELLEQHDTWCGAPKCDMECTHGYCARSSYFPFKPECHCTDKWNGTLCDQVSCDPACDHGTCIRDEETGKGKCICPVGWTGPSCDQASCPNGCLHDGVCEGPNKCVCPKGWCGVRCEIAVCDPECENGAKCIRPDVCKCPLTQNVNGTVKEGFSGKTCGKGPEWWFGKACDDCVAEGNQFCLKDGECVPKGTEVNSTTCPESSKSKFDEHSPLVVSGQNSPCLAEYRYCARLAEPVVQWINREKEKVGCVCDKEVRDFIEAMEDEMNLCGGIQITSIDQGIGYLKVDETYDKIHTVSVALWEKECKYKSPVELKTNKKAAKPEADDDAKNTTKTKDGNVFTRNEAKKSNSTNSSKKLF